MISREGYSSHLSYTVEIPNLPAQSSLITQPLAVWSYTFGQTVNKRSPIQLQCQSLDLSLDKKVYLHIQSPEPFMLGINLQCPGQYLQSYNDTFADADAGYGPNSLKVHNSALQLSITQLPVMICIKFSSMLFVLFQTYYSAALSSEVLDRLRGENILYSDKINIKHCMAMLTYRMPSLY